MTKFAPMGSACCFPIEAAIFWALAIAAMYPSTKAIYSAFFHRRARQIPHMERVSVFGDDIIIPNRYAESYCTLLEDLGLTVNHTKSYTSGPFRESCGADYYDGTDVSIVKVGNLPICDGTKDENNYAMFRTRDFINNVVAKCGMWDSNRGVELFRELYQTPHLTRSLLSFGNERWDAAQVGNTLTLLGVPDLMNTSLKRRHHQGVTQVKVLCEKGVDICIDASGWSHVLRAFLMGSRDRNLDGPDRSHAGIVTPARRLRYNKSWVKV